MKILIGYDGSKCSEAALEDLRRAGLPASAEALVMTVADVWLWPEEETTVAEPDPLGLERARAHARQALEEARRLAEVACQRVRAHFPGWEVRAEAIGDSPAWGLIKRADEWSPDLIVVGSHGRSALGRFVLGSVSQKVLYEARCSVRIARAPLRPAEDALRLIVGVDGSSHSHAALETVAARVWPEGTAVRVLSALDGVLSPSDMGPLRWIARDDESSVARWREDLERMVSPLRARGLLTTVVVQRGSAKRALIEEAEKWQADAVFIGARGLRSSGRLSLGSVAAAVASRAPCSVEVIRPREDDLNRKDETTSK